MAYKLIYKFQEISNNKDDLVVINVEYYEIISNNYKIKFVLKIITAQRLLFQMIQNEGIKFYYFAFCCNQEFIFIFYSNMTNTVSFISIFIKKQ